MKHVPSNPRRFRGFGGRFNDADKRNTGLPGDRIKNKVGRVRRHQGKSRVGACQPFHFFAQKRGELFQFAGCQHLQRLLQVEAVYDDVWRAAVRIALPIQSNDPAVILDGRFRTDSADDSNPVHLFARLSCNQRAASANRNVTSPAMKRAKSALRC